jgi:hypothetical protein
MQGNSVDWGGQAYCQQQHQKQAQPQTSHFGDGSKVCFFLYVSCYDRMYCINMSTIGDMFREISYNYINTNFVFQYCVLKLQI